MTLVDTLWTDRPLNLSHIRDARLRFVQADAGPLESDVRHDEIHPLASPASASWHRAGPLRSLPAAVHGTMNVLGLPEDGAAYCGTATSEPCGDPLVGLQPKSARGSVDCTGPRSACDESNRCSESLRFEAWRTQRVRWKAVRLFNGFGPRTRPDGGRTLSCFLT